MHAVPQDGVKVTAAPLASVFNTTETQTVLQQVRTPKISPSCRQKMNFTQTHELEVAGATHARALP